MKLIAKHIIILLFFLAKFSEAQSNKYIYQGEKISYSVTYGLITAGELDVFVDTVTYKVDKRICFKTQITGRTIGAVGVFAKIQNTYTSFIDTSNLLSYKFVRIQNENDYSLYESTEFDRNNDLSLVSRRKEDQSIELKSYKIEKGIEDMVSTYFKLRNIDFDTISKNKLIEIKIFLEDTTLAIRIKFLGKQKLKTPLGRINTWIISPIVPKTKNSFLIQKDPIKAWITNDKYRIPLKIQLNTKWGTVNAEIVDYNLIQKKKHKFLFF